MNCMKFMSVMFLLILNVSVDAQYLTEFYTQINIASKLTETGKIDEAISSYENAFGKVEYVHTKYLDKVLKLAKLNEDKERVNFYKKRIKKQRKGTDDQLIAKVDSLFIEDQKLRTRKYWKAYNYCSECLEDNNCNKNSKKYLRSKKLKDEFLKKDFSNVQSLLALFEQHGYIGEKLIGANSYKVVVILLHYDNDFNNEKLEPVLEKALLEGKILPIYFAQIQDRHLYTHDESQKYWTWPCASKSKKLAFSESDIPQILKQRERIGIYDSNITQIRKRRYWLLKNEYNY